MAVTEKKKFVLRLDPRTMDAVEKWAADDFRSVNGQIEWLITQALAQRKRLKEKDTPSKKDGAEG